MPFHSWRAYAGTGVPLGQREGRIPAGQDLRALDRPQDYLAEPGLRDAVNVALNLSVPLLLTGEPGTGKTQLAHSLAYELALGEPLVFNTKTTSTARDLFYRYDALQHFRDAQLGGEAGRRLDPSQYVEYEAVGVAIIRAMEPAKRPETLSPKLREMKPGRSVVLIDELDKAPRDLPNDVLHEIEAMQFTVRETGQTFGAKTELRPIMVLTSNSEKNLPDAFLRRCVFYHLTFPERVEDLMPIVQRRLGQNGKLAPDDEQLAKHAVAEFLEMRGKVPWLKKPATAELLAWLRVLIAHKIDPKADLAEPQRDLVRMAFSALAKTPEDLQELRKRLPRQTG